MQGFCHGCNLLVDVVEDAALPLELHVDRLCAELGFVVELIAEMLVGLLEALAVAAAVADEEAEGGG